MVGCDLSGNDKREASVQEMGEERRKTTAWISKDQVPFYIRRKNGRKLSTQGETGG